MLGPLLCVSINTRVSGAACKERLDIATGTRARTQDARADVLGTVMAIDFRLEGDHQLASGQVVVHHDPIFKGEIGVIVEAADHVLYRNILQAIGR